MTKICSTCKRDKSLEEFGRGSAGIYYRVCKACKNPDEYGYKVCTKCFEQKDLTEFQERPDAPQAKYKAQCKKCIGDYLRAWQLRTKYAMDEEIYNRLKTIQNNSCAICHREKELVIDHCHASGKVRGLLCNTCNRAIGLLKDDPIILETALNYVKNDEAIF